MLCPSTLSLKPEVLEDLRYQLKTNLDQIVTLFADYTSCICTLVKKKGVSVQDLGTYLLQLPALKCDRNEQRYKLLLEIKAVTVNEIFDRVISGCASFLNYDIYQAIAKKYRIDNDRKLKKLKYPEHLKAYLEKHKICEFVKINPLLENLTFIGSSEKLILKFDMDLTERVHKVFNVKAAVAKILGLMPSALHFCSINEGCVIVIFLIPRHIAAIIFTGDTKFTLQQLKEFQTLRIMWLKCGNFKFDIKDDHQCNDSGEFYDHIILYTVHVFFYLSIRVLR